MVLWVVWGGGFMGQPTSNCPEANYLNTKIVASNFAAAAAATATARQQQVRGEKGVKNVTQSKCLCEKQRPSANTS